MGSFKKTAQRPERLGNRVGYELKRVQHDLRLSMDAAFTISP